MDLMRFSEHFPAFLPVALLSLAVTALGSFWIDHLYLQVQDKTLLSFPEQVTKRAKYRKPLLLVLLMCCIGKAWIIFSSYGRSGEHTGLKEETLQQRAAGRKTF